MTIRLSVLDQSPVITGYSARDAVAASIDLARLADELGYHRYWCAEHHGLRGVCNPCPEVLLARIGAETRRIRIGRGGVMLPYYSPFKVAEQSGCSRRCIRVGSISVSGVHPAPTVAPHGWSPPAAMTRTASRAR